ncbi:phytanoyl-CoA dioxygenase family protein [Granulicella sp. S190]|uniref:phytanoyl-CoA dioxygenase family protein n=1 Tax=Granulicella sp. S190 TaxID=1747226 RepID=UPI00131CAFA3|nr:phytanoyl-CoA dioxygenase family protein [Granulicella sp. S190]
MKPTDIKVEIDANGFAIQEAVLSSKDVSNLLLSLERIGKDGPVRKRGGVFAIRNLLDASSEVRDVAYSPSVRKLVEPILGSKFFPVRGILFDKIPDANWKVPWHQDVTIAVQDKVEAEGFGPWSVKADVLHVQPPASILESMVSVRLHLDNCGEENGALRVIPGSHKRGRIPEDQIQSIRDLSDEAVCSVKTGGALLMRPLLLHASSPSQFPGHRRVVHLDFAAASLPSGMRWFSEAVPAEMSILTGETTS